MKTARWLRYALAFGVMASLAGPAGAQAVETAPCTDENGALVFNELPQWVSAPARKVGNLGALGTGDAYPSWDGTAPTQSFQQGGGGASASYRLPFNATGSEYDPRGSGHFEGTFNGCIDNLFIDLYVGSPLPPAGGNIVTDLRLLIDGTQVYQTPGDPGPEINAPSEGGFYRMRFGFTNIHTLMSGTAADFKPLDGEHTLSLTLFSQYINDASFSYLYDATDAPSQLTFNKTTGLTPYTKLDVTAV